MTGEQLDELMTVAVRMQRDAEADRNFPSANFAYAVQFAVLELRRTREISSTLAAENAALKKYICDECYVENVRTGHYACAGHGMPSTPATDVYLAEVRAQGADAVAGQHRRKYEELKPINVFFAEEHKEAQEFAEFVAAQLRKGVQS